MNRRIEIWELKDIIAVEQELNFFDMVEEDSDVPPLLSFPDVFENKEKEFEHIKRKTYSIKKIDSYRFVLKNKNIKTETDLEKVFNLVNSLKNKIECLRDELLFVKNENKVLQKEVNRYREAEMYMNT